MSDDRAERRLPVVSEPSRRELLKLLGASFAFAGAAGCTVDEPQKMLAYHAVPGGVVPGSVTRYATSMALEGDAVGLLVDSYAGRPVKIEGNPAHPASLGATGVFEQAAILGLYDPDRAKDLRRDGASTSWEHIRAALGRDRDDQGRRLRFLLEPTSSLLVADLIGRVLVRFPEARFTFWSPVRTDHAAAGTELVFGRRLALRHDLRRASVMLALDADFLASGSNHLRHAHDFAQRRRPASPDADMCRLYVVESMPTPTGTLADHRLRARPSEVARVAAGVAAELVHGLGKAPPGMSDELASALARLRGGPDQRFLRAVADDLARAGAEAAVFAGERQTPLVHALAHLIHAAVGARTYWLGEPTRVGGADAGEQSFVDLVGELRAGDVDTLVVMEANPAYSAPCDLELAELVKKVPDTIYAGLHENETAGLCRSFVPLTHFLESWGDACAPDGTISFVQPLLRPLFNGHTISELLATFAGDPFPDARRLLRERWQREHGPSHFDAWWDEALRAGFLPNTELAHVDVPFAPRSLARELAGISVAPAAGFEATFLPDPAVHDGRFANNAWLQELPRPITKLTWDNAAMMSPATAARLGVIDGDVVELALLDRSLQIPALLVPGHADDVVSLPLGHGRTGAEELAAGVGVDVNRIRPSEAPFIARGIEVTRVPGESRLLARTQTHFSPHGRPIALRTTLAAYREDPGFTREQSRPVPTFLEPVKPLEPMKEQWAMTIDTTICTGCSACVVACQAENNVLVVGKTHIAQGREMHWLRIDSYLEGSPEDPTRVNQPMACQHCERAPCEYVCPVNATVHSPDGLNEMVYNRCVGTRFCSNNCPYKVRRFNWFNWSDHVPYNDRERKLQRNPDVTVRERGVMEKCTYCVQRIREADIRADVERRAIRSGEVVTACQQACPTGAIQFASLTHDGSKAVEWRREPRAFAVLNELGTVPRTRYLARIDNPNPELG